MTKAARDVGDGQYDAKYWSEICRELHEHLRTQSPQNISLTLSALARLRIRDKELLDHVADALSPSWLRVFNAQDLALLCSSYSKLMHPAPRLFQLCAGELLWKLPDASPQELALIAGAFAKVRAYDATLFRHVAALSLLRLEAFEARHVVNVLHAYASVDAPQPELFRQLAQRLTADAAAGQLEAVGVAQGCFAVSRGVVQYPGILEDTLRPLLEKLARRLVAIGREPGSSLDPRHIAALARACLDAGALSIPLVRFMGARLPPGGDAGGHTPRPVLLDVVDAAAALRATLVRVEPAAKAGQRGAPSDDAGKLDATLRSALEGLCLQEISPAASLAAREHESRRLQAWDAELAEWLPESWPTKLRPRLIGRAPAAG